MSLKNIIKSKKVTYFIYIVFSLLILSELTFFYYKYTNAKSQIKEKKDKIEKIKRDIATLSNMTTNDSLVTQSDEKKFHERFVKKGIEPTIGAYVYKTFISEKGKDKENIYYRIKLFYKAKDEVSLRKLIALIMLNDNIYSVENINKGYINIVIKEKLKKGK